MLKVFDGESETPELLWDAEMRADLRSAVASTLDDALAGPSGKTSEEFKLPYGYRVRYKKLEDELYVGGVYVRLFLKEPTFSLRDPTTFLEKLLQHWTHELGVYTGGKTPKVEYPDETKNALATAQQDKLELVTSASVYLCKVKESLCDKLAEWGYIAKALTIIEDVLDQELVGTPLLSIVRLLHVASNRLANVEMMSVGGEANGKGGVVDSTIRAIGKSQDVSERSELHRDCAFMVELLKKVFTVALGDVKAAKKLRASMAQINTTNGHVQGGPTAQQYVAHPGQQYQGYTSNVAPYNAMAPSPAPGDEPVRKRLQKPQAQQYVAQFQGYTSNIGPYNVMAPSPAPGDEPVRKRMQNPLEHPLAFGLGDQPAPPPVQNPRAPAPAPVNPAAYGSPYMIQGQAPAMATQGSFHGQRQPQPRPQSYSQRSLESTRLAQNQQQQLGGMSSDASNPLMFHRRPQVSSPGQGHQPMVGGQQPGVQAMFQQPNMAQPYGSQSPSQLQATYSRSQRPMTQTSYQSRSGSSSSGSSQQTSYVSRGQQAGTPQPVGQQMAGASMLSYSQRSASNQQRQQQPPPQTMQQVPTGSVSYRNPSPAAPSSTRGIARRAVPTASSSSQSFSSRSQAMFAQQQGGSQLPPQGGSTPISMATQPGVLPGGTVRPRTNHPLDIQPQLNSPVVGNAPQTMHSPQSMGDPLGGNRVSRSQREAPMPMTNANPLMGGGSMMSSSPLGAPMPMTNQNPLMGGGSMMSSSPLGAPMPMTNQNPLMGGGNMMGSSPLGAPMPMTNQNPSMGLMHQQSPVYHAQPPSGQLGQVPAPMAQVPSDGSHLTQQSQAVVNPTTTSTFQHSMAPTGLAPQGSYPPQQQFPAQAGMMGGPPPPMVSTVTDEEEDVEPQYRPTPVVEGTGIDARTPDDPKMLAEQQAVTAGGAPGAAQGRVALLQSALSCRLPEFLLDEVLENPTLAKVKDPAAAKVHAVDLLKLLTQDPGFGPKFKLILDEMPSWKKYKSQDHSLFITGTEQKTDYFLTDGSSGEPTKMLTQG